MRVLVVDDSRAIRAVISRMLAQLGFTSVTAANGSEALAALGSEGPFDLALVDWNMPIMNGIEFVQAVRREVRDERMKIMMVTTETGVERIAEALEAGATEYLMKPFTFEALTDKLALMGFTQVVSP